MLNQFDTTIDKPEKIEDFHQRKFEQAPENLRNEIGHFNVFELKPFVGERAKAIPYRRRDYYKIMLVEGNGIVHYADKVIEVRKQALSFSNPQIPYKWEQRDRITGGYYCIFNQQFFHQFGDLTQYSVFQPNGTHIFELPDEKVEQVSKLYRRMFEEIESEYVHKYDVLRTLALELLHLGMKMEPGAHLEKRYTDASRRIYELFRELLERQFPIDDTHQKVNLCTASDFAQQLNIHVNHLNRAVKKTTDQTTTRLITQRILQEAKILLKHSAWSVVEIAYALGFTEATHFNNFFKKHTQLSPLQFRNH